MKFFVWGRTPWNQDVLLHVSWDLLWASAIGGVLFLIGHALYLRFWAKPEVFENTAQGGQVAARLPEHIKRHTLAARLFHWIMAAAMFVLLFTSFLPIIGVKFAWVTLHWIAGVLLTLSVIYHIVHASIWLNFWSIWPTKDDLDDASKRVRLALGQPAAPPRKHPKYPLENKLYHGIITLTGIAAIVTGIVMMARVRTPLWTRNPYLFSDQTWGVTYVLHGLAGVSLVALVMVHVYFAVRPEKWWITNSMIFGWIAKRQYLAHHDPTRWVVAPESSAPQQARSDA
jgi:cytochrome b subunit of formate dehydrogenase